MVGREAAHAVPVPVPVPVPEKNVRVPRASE
jgi:hypothetical protein